jgi:hypothetical protein
MAAIETELEWHKDLFLGKLVSIKILIPGNLFLYSVDNPLKAALKPIKNMFKYSSLSSNLLKQFASNFFVGNCP